MAHKVKYFSEYYKMYDWLEANKGKVRKIDYNFTFAYGYQLIYEVLEG